MPATDEPPTQSHKYPVAPTRVLSPRGGHPVRRARWPPRSLA